MSVVAVLDIGKTSVKLSAATPDGALLETITAGNPVLPGPPYRHHDMGALESWVLDGLASLGTRHRIAAVVATGHGSGGVLVGPDGPAMPMIDYEQPAPEGLDDTYRTIAGSFRERGSPVMLGSAHLARQLLWLERDFPDAFAGATAFLAVPQYWAWRLSGVAASEVTSLAAQSHLWCSVEGRPATLVAARGWERLLPPLRPAWERLGPLTPALAARTGLPGDTAVLTGVHDSSANLYRFQAAGLSNLTVVSTGTWIVALSDRPGPDFDREQPGLCCNADVTGHPLPGLLTMGGREFSAVAGDTAGVADAGTVARLVASGTMALPSFGSDDALFPGTARRGRIVGPLASEAAVRPSLAVLYAALLTDRCLDPVPTANVVLDGSFTRDPLFAALVAALNPGRTVRVAPDSHGVSSGAALLAGHATRTAPAPLALRTPVPIDIPTLSAYRDRWRAEANTKETTR